MKPKICIVVANYYHDIAKDLVKGSTSLLKTHNLKFKILYAPGIFEIPFLLTNNIGKYNAFIALGCVIKGETPHFDFISRAAINGIIDLSIKYKKPITNGIITCLNKEQAKERSDPNKKNKGEESARALLHLLGILKD